MTVTRTLTAAESEQYVKAIRAAHEKMIKMTDGIADATLVFSMKKVGDKYAGSLQVAASEKSGLSVGEIVQCLASTLRDAVADTKEENYNA